MPPARCLGRRWRFANDDYFRFVPPAVIGNLICLVVSCVAFRDFRFLSAFGLLRWIFVMLVVGDIVLGFWSTRGKIFDRGGHRKYLDFFLGLRFVLMLFANFVLLYRFVFSPYPLFFTIEAVKRTPVVLAEEVTTDEESSATTAGSSEQAARTVFATSSTAYSDGPAEEVTLKTTKSSTRTSSKTGSTEDPLAATESSSTAFQNIERAEQGSSFMKSLERTPPLEERIQETGLSSDRPMGAEPTGTMGADLRTNKKLSGQTRPAVTNDAAAHVRLEPQTSAFVSGSGAQTSASPFLFQQEAEGEHPLDPRSEPSDRFARSKTMAPPVRENLDASAAGAANGLELLSPSADDRPRPHHRLGVDDEQQDDLLDDQSSTPVEKAIRARAWTWAETVAVIIILFHALLTTLVAGVLFVALSDTRKGRNTRSDLLIRKLILDVRMQKAAGKVQTFWLLGRWTRYNTLRAVR